MIRRGLYLQGGGAKGAYQAGVLKAFEEAGRVFDALAGTSIGSLNGYFWASGQMAALEPLWLDITLPETFVTPDGLFVETAFLLEKIHQYPATANRVEHWFVNYAQVSGRQLHNRYADLAGTSLKHIIEVVGHSTRLPIRDQDNKYDLGLYEGRLIDGGMVNNAFVEPLVDLAVDEIIVVPLNNTFETTAFDRYHGEVRILYPPMQFVPGDTVRLERDQIADWYRQGVETGREWCRGNRK